MALAPGQVIPRMEKMVVPDLSYGLPSEIREIRDALAVDGLKIVEIVIKKSEFGGYEIEAHGGRG